MAKTIGLVFPAEAAPKKVKPSASADGKGKKDESADKADDKDKKDGE